MTVRDGMEVSGVATGPTGPAVPTCCTRGTPEATQMRVEVFVNSSGTWEVPAPESALPSVTVRSATVHRGGPPAAGAVVVAVLTGVRVGVRGPGVGVGRVGVEGVSEVDAGAGFEARAGAGAEVTDPG